jgi:alkylated DNA repair protein (DNA oxidative demethylase)
MAGRVGHGGKVPGRGKGAVKAQADAEAVLPDGKDERPEGRTMTQTAPVSGVRVRPGYLDAGAQAELVAAVRQVVEAAPLFVPRMPKSGRPMSVRMSNCGPLAWVTDEAGYRYQQTHPVTGRSWPPIPDILLRAWDDLARYPHPPQACLINYYGPDAKMGLHQDRDEQDFAAPVVSLSLGDTCLFRVGGTKRSDPTRSLRLASGDALVLGGAARLAFHGVDRIYPGTSRLLPQGGRINLTMRRVTLPDSRS